MTCSYEFRPVSFLSFVAMPVSTAGSVDLRQWHAYAVEGDGELQEHEDRANAEDCWRDWWKTGRDWIRPERCEWCEEMPCCGAALGCSTT